jgi:hypothetical protein
MEGRGSRRCVGDRGVLRRLARCDPAWRRPPSDLAVRSIAKAALVLAPRWRLAGAPGLERTHQNRGRDRHADEQELLIQNAFNRADHAKDSDQERNWQDGRHGEPIFGSRRPFAVLCNKPTPAARFGSSGCRGRHKIRGRGIAVMSPACIALLFGAADKQREISHHIRERNIRGGSGKMANIHGAFARGRSGRNP